MLRYFKTDYKRIRPEDMMIGHTGYLVFAVKTLPLPEPPVAAEESDDAGCVCGGASEHGEGE